MTKYLIPTDFSEESISSTEKIIEQLKDEKAELLFMFSDYLDDSITELLFYSPTKFLKSKMPEYYEKWFSDFQKSNSDKFITSLLPFHGFTTNAFLNFTEANKVDCCIIPQKLHYKLGVNPNKFITKSKLKTI